MYKPHSRGRTVGTPQDLLIDDAFVDLAPMVHRRLVLKCEGFNFAGSVKVKSALRMVNDFEDAGLLRPGSAFVESSSGSLGVALSMIAANRGYRFTCVTDSRCNERNVRMMEAYGAEVVVISEPHPVEGLLGSRIRYIQQMCRSTPEILWLNQYANDSNWLAHYETTGPAVARAFPDLEFLFIGAGTTGTLTGCARYLKSIGHPARIVAVDSVGSVTFGGPSGPRHIPGLGTGRRPEIVDESVVDEVLMVPEREAIRMCRFLAKKGYLLGGSTGTVVAGAMQRLSAERDDVQALGIAADLGERYLDSVYDDAWVHARFGEIGEFDPNAENLSATAAGDAN